MDFGAKVQKLLQIRKKSSTFAAQMSEGANFMAQFLCVIANLNDLSINFLIC
jgi:hypothetical protein